MNGGLAKSISGSLLAKVLPQASTAASWCSLAIPEMTCRSSCFSPATAAIGLGQIPVRRNTSSSGSSKVCCHAFARQVAISTNQNNTCLSGSRHPLLFSLFWDKTMKAKPRLSPTKRQESPTMFPATFEATTLQRKRVFVRPKAKGLTIDCAFSAKGRKNAQNAHLEDGNKELSLGSGYPAWCWRISRPRPSAPFGCTDCLARACNSA